MAGPDGLSARGEHVLAGMLAVTRDMALMLAPNINSYKRFQPGSFAPTALRWGRDNRTCALRLVGHGPSLRVEHRLPGADANPYLAIAALVAAARHGLSRELSLEPEYAGNAYADGEAPKAPVTLKDALELWRGSEFVRWAFGDEVVAHYARAAEVEVEAFDAAVTDWELHRGYERL